VDSLVDVDIALMLKMGGIGRIGSRVESLGSNLGLPEMIWIREPGLDPRVLHQIRVRNHGFLRDWASARVNVLGRESVLLGLGQGEWCSRSLRGDWCVNFEALLLIRGRVRLH
jgi:hypothetical protein